MRRGNPLIYSAAETFCVSPQPPRAARLPRVARAQAYPTRPVRMIVPFAPGGQTDADRAAHRAELSEHLGKQFFVENMAGAGGNIGTGRAAQAAHDGYTILVVDGTGFVVNPLHLPRSAL